MSGVPAESYIDPWSISFDSRFKNFMSGSKRLAYFYEQPDNSTFRYRVYNMIQVIQANPHWGWSASFFSYEDRGRLERVVDSAHALVICRTRYNDEIAVLIARARAKRAVVVYDIDDFVFDSSYVQLIVETLDQDLKYPILTVFRSLCMERFQRTTFSETSICSLFKKLGTIHTGKRENSATRSPR